MLDIRSPSPTFRTRRRLPLARLGQLGLAPRFLLKDGRQLGPPLLILLPYPVLIQPFLLAEEEMEALLQPRVLFKEEESLGGEAAASRGFALQLPTEFGGKVVVGGVLGDGVGFLLCIVVRVQAGQIKKIICFLSCSEY